MQRLTEIPRLVLQLTGEQLPDKPDPARPETQIWYDLKGSICAFGYLEGGMFWMHWPGLASFRFSNTTSETVAYYSEGALIDVIQDVYTRSVLPFVLQIRGIESLHASAVRFHQGVVAFSAPSGSGKSTIAYAFGLRGYDVWADDAVTFVKNDLNIMTFGLPFTIRLTVDALDSLKPFSAKSRRGIIENDSIFTDPEALIGIFLLVEDTTLSPSQPIRSTQLLSAKALTETLENGYCFYTDSNSLKKRMINNYLDLVSLVPVYKLYFTKDIALLQVVMDYVEGIVNKLPDPLGKSLL